MQDFRKRFTPVNCPSNQSLVSFLNVVDNCISSETNEKLIANVSKDEVLNAMSSIGSLKAPGPDGIHAAFYHNYWSIVGNSVYEIVDDFFKNCSPLSSINPESR